MNLYSRIIFQALILLLSVNASLAADPKSSSGLTPLTRAIRLEKFNEAKKHITPELVNKMDQGQYHPLTYAVYTGNNKLIEDLLKAGADPNVVEHNGKTGLYVAANLANPEAIEILHKHGAKRPPATALSPAVAAAYSHSLDTIITLQKLYPGILTHRGQSLLHIACSRGYNDMAKYLTTQKINLTSYNRSNQSALHLAAINQECSPELVTLLISAGLNPFERCRGRHFAPKTPLDFAASRGALDKIKVIINNTGTDGHTDFIRQSIFIAAAHNHPNIVRYLSNHLGFSIDDIHTEIVKRQKQVSPKEAHHPIQATSLKDIFPRTNSQASTRPTSSHNLAIISPQSLENEAILLTQELSAIDNITVLERSQIARVIQDNSLSSLYAADSTTLHANLNLIPASSIVLLAKKKISVGSFIEITLLQTGSGIATARYAIPLGKFSDPAELKELSHQLAASSLKSKTTSLNAIALSMIPIVPELTSAESLSLSHQINTLLPYYMEATEGCLHITRKQLDYLETEKSIGAKGSYWSAAWVIDGGFSLNSKNLITLTLRASHKNGEATFNVTHTLSPDKLHSGFKDAWSELAKKINLSLPNKSLVHTTEEIQLLMKHAQRLSDANHPKDALDLIRSALILGDYNRTQLEQFLLTAIQALPATKRLRCRFIQKNPEALEPETRDSLSAHTSAYMDLCDRAIEYSSLLEGQLEMGHLSVRGGGKSHMFNEIISSALEELSYYRRLISSSIHNDATKKEIQKLDAKIAQLTHAYLQNIRGHRSEGFTLEALIQYSSRYYQKFHPDILSSMLNRSATLCLKSRNSGFRPETVLITGLSQAIDDGLDSTPWMNVFNILKQSKSRSYREYAKAAELLTSRSRADQIRLIHDILESYASSGTSQEDQSSYSSPFKFLPHDLARELVGNEYPVKHEIITQTKSYTPPVGGLSGYPWEALSEIHQPSEYSRSLGVYVWLKDIKNRNSKYWEIACSTYMENDGSLQESHKLRAVDWSIIRSIAMKNPKLSSKAKSLLDGLATPAVVSNADVIQLASPIIFPRINGATNLGQFSLISQSIIHNDSLWIPATYCQTKSLDPLKNQPQHVIHIISLTSGKIETVHLPDGCSDSYTSSSPFNGRIDPANLKVIFMGENYAYYITQFKRKSRLFSIRLKTRKVSEIKLPLPKIIAAPCNVSGDTLYLSISTAKKRVLNHRANLLISIQGNQIVKTLVSNKRNPALTPLDHPDTLIEQIKNTQSGLQIISNRSLIGRGEPLKSKVKIAAFNKKTNMWTISAEKHRLKETINEMQNFYTQFYITRHSFQIHNKNFYPINPIQILNQFHSSINISKDKTLVSGIWRRQFHDPNYSSSLISLPVNIEPITQDVFKDKIYSKPKPYSPGDPPSDLYYRGRKFDYWWYSPNELIEKKKFSLYIIGRWKNDLIIGLHHNFSGFPAIWKVNIDAVGSKLTPKSEQR